MRTASNARYQMSGRVGPPPGGEGLGVEALGVDEAKLEREQPVRGALRQEVIDRDNSMCRVCGRYVDTPATHHIIYKSQGGLDIPSNLVTVGWLPGHDCHLAVVHANKRVWQPIMKLVVQHPGVSGLQILRWSGGL